MRFSIIKAIFQKELLDMSRDRRFLISVAVVPLIVFPLLISGMARVLPLVQRQADADARTMSVAARLTTPSIREGLEKAGLRLVEKDDLKASVQNKSVGAAVEEMPGSPPELRIYVDASDPSSSAAGQRIQAALIELKDRRIREELRSSGIDESVLAPFTVNRMNVAGDRKMAGALYGSILGYVLLLLMFTGGMYPVIDMTAGEKERKTLEALLASPARRSEIAMGKILTAIAAILATACLTVASMAYSLRNLRGNGNGLTPRNPGMAELQQSMGTIPLDASTIGLLLVTLVPLAVFAASLMFAIALKARSFKEGQSYLTPLALVVIFPALLGGLPGLKMTPALCLIPIFNASQMIHGILLGEVSAVNFAVTLAANLGYSAIAFFLARRMFDDEKVLFRS
jgi:sodium transport system permease protein